MMAQQPGSIWGFQSFCLHSFLNPNIYVAPTLSNFSYIFFSLADDYAQIHILFLLTNKDRVLAFSFLSMQSENEMFITPWLMASQEARYWFDYTFLCFSVGQLEWVNTDWFIAFSVFQGQEKGKWLQISFKLLCERLKSEEFGGVELP